MFTVCYTLVGIRNRYDKKGKAAWCWKKHWLCHILGAQQMVLNNIHNNKTVVIIIIICYWDKVLPLRTFQPPWVRQTSIIGAARL